MLSIAVWKRWAIALVCLLGILFTLPNVISDQNRNKLPSWLQNTINLGLELKGGSYLQLQVDLKTVAQEYLTHLIDDTRSSLRKKSIGYSGLSLDKKSATPQLTFTLTSPETHEEAVKILKKIDSALHVKVEGSKVIASLDEKMMAEKNRAVIDQSIEVIRRRIDESGTKEPIIQRQGEDCIVVQLPGVDDPEEVKRLIGRTAKLTFRLVDSTAEAVPVENGKPRSAPPGSEYLEETLRGGRVIYLAVKKQVELSGDMLVDAQATINPTSNLPCVSIKFNDLGSKKFFEVSKNNVGKQFAIILDLDGEKVISAPVFNEAIPSGQAVISGEFNIKEANELALLMRAGALPAPLKVVAEQTVGPSLGADSINDGQLATLIAFALVSVFMFLSYGLFGLFADIALTFNLILLFASMSLLQATLTLPGIAGIALTIGMAVDANVLIYERIKEEWRASQDAFHAIERGYKRAFTTIIDSNLTTLFGAAVLFEFGSGPIRGFAVTLALGILISLFTALSLTKLIIFMWARRKHSLSLPF